MNRTMIFREHSFQKSSEKDATSSCPVKYILDCSNFIQGYFITFYDLDLILDLILLGQLFQGITTKLSDEVKDFRSAIKKIY